LIHLIFTFKIIENSAYPIGFAYAKKDQLKTA